MAYAVHADFYGGGMRLSVRHYTVSRVSRLRRSLCLFGKSEGIWLHAFTRHWGHSTLFCFARYAESRHASVERSPADSQKTGGQRAIAAGSGQGFQQSLPGVLMRRF